jgi:hypothetical protein
MRNVWLIAKELKALPKTLEEIARLPYTISYVLRKQMQLDSFEEISADKRPPDRIVWWGTAEEIDQWIKSAFNLGTSNEILISDAEIE